MTNLHKETVAGFGDEWERFDQSELSELERDQLLEQYFAIFPWSQLPEGPVGFDMGCGSGRWAAGVAPRVKELICIDPSSAIEVARRNLAAFANVRFIQAEVAEHPIADQSMDFGYSLGVLHHVPDTAAGISACVRMLKPGAPFLVYLYYAFDNRPKWFRALWRASDWVRRGVSILPHGPRYVVPAIREVLAILPPYVKTLGVS